MPYYNFKNNLKSTLQTKLWSDATSIYCNHVVNSEDANARRNAWPDFPFTLTLVNTVNDNIEVIKCTGLAGNFNNYIAFACDRAQENTTAQTFEIATTSVEHRLTSGALNSIISIQASPSVEGHVKLDALAADGSNTAAPGGFGLGRSDAGRRVTDLNAVLENGQFSFLPTATGLPSGWTAAGVGITYSHNANTKIQLIFGYLGPGELASYTRSRFSTGVWGEWFILPHGISDSTATTSSTIAASATAVKAVATAADYATTKSGTSSTASGTAAKVVTCSDFKLSTNARVVVTFSNANTVAGAITLNVNGTGAKSVYNQKGIISTTNTALFAANQPIEFMYNGAGWVFFDIAGKANLDMDNLTQIGSTKIANMAMPAGRRVSYGAPSASGQTYTAPGDGYFSARYLGATGNSVLNIVNPDTGVANGGTFPYGEISAFIPCAKGQTINIYYSFVGGAWVDVCFIFAGGAY